MKTHIHSPFINPLLAAISLAGTITILIIGKNIIIPIVLGILFAFLLLPPVRSLEKLKIPRSLSIAIMIFAIIIVVGIIGTLISFAGREFITSIPNYQSSITQNTLAAQYYIEQVFHISIDAQKQWLTENINLLEIATQNIGTIATSITSIITTLGLTFIYAFFILYYRTKVMIFFKKLLGQADEQILFTTLRKLVHIVPRYLSGVSWVALILTIINSIGFWIVGVPNPLFFGVLAAVLNIIPYLGPIIGFGIVIIFSFITVGPAVALGAIILFLVVQFFENNFLTPRIAGGTIHINPLAAIIGIIIGSKLWGVVGTIIALPILGMIKVIADSIPSLKPWGYLVGDEDN